MNFPTWRYHATEQPALVQDAAELQALGEGWADTPAAFEASAAPVPELDYTEDDDSKDVDDERQGDEQPEPELHQLTPAQKAAATRAAKKAAAAEKTNE